MLSRPSAPFLCQNSKQYLVLAFFSGVLLTLLLMALVFFIFKSCRKCHSRPSALAPDSEPPAKLSSPEETLTYASMAFELSEENHNHCTVNHSEDSDHVVYDQVKVTSSPSLFNEA